MNVTFWTLSICFGVFTALDAVYTIGAIGRGGMESRRMYVDRNGDFSLAQYLAISAGFYAGVLGLFFWVGWYDHWIAYCPSVALGVGVAACVHATFSNFHFRR